jgi:D-xylose 1-dehydrogenase (NADP+, D-xylono-1,5-lactone-forming)
MTVRFGILGAGRILGKIGPAFGLARGVKLVAIASRDGARAEAAARQHGAARAHAGYEALIANPEVDAVFNTLHNGLHCEWTVRALEAGKHVLCEKPLACSSAEADKMFATAHAQRRQLMEAFMYRFHPQTIEAVRRVRAGELGKLVHIRASYATRLGRDADNPRYWPDAGGGALMDVGCYCVNASLLFAGTKPEHISARARYANGVDLMLSGLLGFGGGLTAQILCGFDSEGVFGVELVGTEAKLVIPNPWLPPGGVGEIQVTRSGQMEVVRLPAQHWLAHFAAEIEHFAECVRENRAPTVVTEADSRETMRVIEALRADSRLD